MAWADMVWADVSPGVFVGVSVDLAEQGLQGSLAFRLVVFQLLLDILE
jgi:hypothetical protein